MIFSNIKVLIFVETTKEKRFFFYASMNYLGKNRQIKLKADGSFDYALAPNGKKSNLNERQWLQVRTKPFINWFGDWMNDPANASKVVDENGEPLVVYHGTNADFTEFKFTTPREAFYFGNKEGAKGYTTTDKTMPLFVNIKNPLLAENYNIVSQFPKVAKDNGHDGIIWKPSKVVDKSAEFVAFESNQIKSATDNIGTFSTENDDIQMMAEPYSKQHPYRNKVKATTRQRREILGIVKSKRYNNNGTDIVTLREDNYQYVYVIDHSSHALLEENQKENDEQGIITDLFGIRRKYNINKLTEDDIRYITRNIASDYGGSEASIQHRLQELGITTEQLPGIDIDAAIKRGIGDYGEVAAETGEVGEQTISDRSSIDSGENQGLFPKSDTPFYLLKTPKGEVEIYGFIDPETLDMYLDDATINPEHPIHEYTHLWDRALYGMDPDHKILRVEEMVSVQNRI